MTPVLLDQKSIFKAGIYLALVIAVVFISGYYTGYQRADSGQGVDLNKTMVLALPKPAHADVSEFEPFIPQAQIPGADIDVDSPENAADAVGDQEREVMQANEADSRVATAIQQTTNAIETPVITENRGVQNEKHLKPATSPVATASTENASALAAIGTAESHPHNAISGQSSADNVEPAGQAVIIDSASAHDARYTIQVGVFADADNAMRREAELQDQQLTAYVNEYRNKLDQPRYNVRFGFFKDKSSALAALAYFEQNLSGSGYVTRIRAR